VSAKIHGSCALLAVIDIDGRPKRLRISVPLGFGLDERAVEAVQHRSFQPATQRDKPVAVEINIEVNFRID
jgi:TonB family protein